MGLNSAFKGLIHAGVNELRELNGLGLWHAWEDENLGGTELVNWSLEIYGERIDAKGNIS